MRWQKKSVCVTNATRGTVVGQRIRVAETGLTRIVGLLGERQLQPGDGLLIVPSQGVHTLGMQFPIDIAVLDNEWKVIAIRPSMRRPVSVKSVFLFLPYKSFFVFEPSRLCRHPSIRTLFERFSLGASWASSFQQVLLPDNRP